MDNITHTAIGALFTESLYQSLPEEIKEKPNFKKSLHILSALASNLPDFDLLMQLIDPSSLGYLINHRGHTHTIPGLILQFALLMFLYFLFFKKNISKEIIKPILYVTGFGLASHIGLDFLNSYGVHPLWPVNNKWYYGDVLFIVEPLIWITSAVTFFHILKSKYFKLPFLMLSLSSPLIFTYTGYGSWFNTALVYLFSTALFFQIKNKDRKLTAKTGLSLVFCIVCAFTLQSFSAKKHIHSSISSLTEDVEIIDIANSPLPANLFCSHFLTLTKLGDEYKIYSGTYSPSKLLLQTCPSSIRAKEFKPNISVDDTEHIKWDGVFSQKISELKEAYSMNCKTKNWFSYSRVPFLKNNTLYDLRYTRRSRAGFANLNLDDEINSCLIFESPWTPPRIKILLSQ